MSDRSEEDIIARTPTMRRDEAHDLAVDFIRYGTKCGVLDAADIIKKRADEIEAEGSASIFAGAIVSELRSQAKRLRELYAGGE